MSLDKMFATNQLRVPLPEDWSLVGIVISQVLSTPTPPRVEYFRLYVVNGISVPTIEEEKACLALAAETLKEACASNTYVYGAGGLYDSWHPFKDVFITQPTLTCAENIEPFFYTLGARARHGLSEMLFCFCASGQADATDLELSKLFTIVLPVCQVCFTGGAKILVRTAIRNSIQCACISCNDCCSAEGKARCSKQCPTRYI